METALVHIFPEGVGGAVQIVAELMQLAVERLAGTPILAGLLPSGAKRVRFFFLAQ